MKSRFCTSVRFWNPARRPRSRPASACRKSISGSTEHDPEKWEPVFGQDRASRKLSMPILEVEDIHTYYGDAYVLQGLSLKLEQGQILGLLGRNGVGKTTLVNSIVGFTP